MYEDFLLQVRKPAQYIGREWNASFKDFDSCSVKFALSFPDLYEIGMSNLGVRIIYGLLNSIPQVVCERFFSVGSDMENILRSSGKEILSIDSGRKLGDFDIIGFSLGSELNYTNVLNILELGKIPLKASMRHAGHPLVIAGGPCTLNPEPMHDFFDFFVIGEGEDVLLKIIDVYSATRDVYKRGDIDRAEFLSAFDKLEGVYVPSFYEASYENGEFHGLKPKKSKAKPFIKKTYVENLNQSYYPVRWLVPHVQVVHDRMAVEIMRGCPNRCRFCQARSQYYPLRYRSSDNIKNLSESIFCASGYEELSLLGLSVGDYPKLKELLTDLIMFFKVKGVAVSLPSLKSKSVLGEISSLIGEIKKTGLTFAPEAGSERMRNLLAKDFKCEEFFEVLKSAYSCGYQHVKLYFMIGLPNETTEDLDAIIDFALKASNLRKEVGFPAAQVNVSVSNFIPKPHTALQWLAMDSVDSITDKQRYLRDKFSKYKRIKISFHNPKMTALECILSRGDRRLSEVISQAFKSGAKFDAWSDCFNFDLWVSSFHACGIDWKEYLRSKEPSGSLPWDLIDVGINKDILIEEFYNSIAM